MDAAARRLSDAIWMLAHDAYREETGDDEPLWKQTEKIQDDYKRLARRELADLINGQTTGKSE